MACSCDRTEARVRSSSLSSSSASQASAASCSKRPEIEFVVLDGEVRMTAGCTLGNFLRFGDGVRYSLIPRPESANCVGVESTESGGRDWKSAYERFAGGEADTGSGGLSMTARVTNAGFSEVLTYTSAIICKSVKNANVEEPSFCLDSLPGT